MLFLKRNAFSMKSGRARVILVIAQLTLAIADIWILTVTQFRITFGTLQPSTGHKALVAPISLTFAHSSQESS